MPRLRGREPPERLPTSLPQGRRKLVRQQKTYFPFLNFGLKEDARENSIKAERLIQNYHRNAWNILEIDYLFEYGFELGGARADERKLKCLAPSNLLMCISTDDRESVKLLKIPLQLI